MIKENDTAPDFTLMGVDGKEHNLGDFKGRYVVLYFYPKDDTPGCTIEGKDFTKLLPEIRKCNADVIGISRDDYDSHCKFRDKHSLKVLLLSDPSSKTIKRYGAYGSRGVFGKGTLRKTFIIDGKGKIIKDFGKVNAIGHAKDVLEYLKALKQ